MLAFVEVRFSWWLPEMCREPQAAPGAKKSRTCLVLCLGDGWADAAGSPPALWCCVAVCLCNWEEIRPPVLVGHRARVRVTALAVAGRRATVSPARDPRGLLCTGRARASPCASRCSLRIRGGGSAGTPPLTPRGCSLGRAWHGHPVQEGKQLSCAGCCLQPQICSHAPCRG